MCTTALSLHLALKSVPLGVGWNRISLRWGEGGTVVFECHVLKFALQVNVMKELYANGVCVCVFVSVFILAWSSD